MARTESVAIAPLALGPIHIADSVPLCPNPTHNGNIVTFGTTSSSSRICADRLWASFSTCPWRPSTLLNSFVKSSVFRPADVVEDCVPQQRVRRQQHLGNGVSSRAPGQSLPGGDAVPQLRHEEPRLFQECYAAAPSGGQPDGESHFRLSHFRLPHHGIYGFGRVRLPIYQTFYHSSFHK